MSGEKNESDDIMESLMDLVYSGFLTVEALSKMEVRHLAQNAKNFLDYACEKDNDTALEIVTKVVGKLFNVSPHDHDEQASAGSSNSTKRSGVTIVEVESSSNESSIYNNPQPCSSRQSDASVWQEPMAATNQPLSLEAESYMVGSYETNKLFIFVYNCSNSNLGEGTSSNVESLTKTFKSCNFAVEVISAFNKETLFADLKRVSKPDFTNVGCLAIAILSHCGVGDDAQRSSEAFQDTEVVDKFRLTTNETLYGKPILFILQTPDWNAASSKWVKDGIRDMGEYCIPLGTDMLVVQSAFPEIDSKRHTDEGSWFISELCRVIMENENEEINSIMTRVKGNFRSHMQRVTLGGIDDRIALELMPITTSTLTRRLVLRNETQMLD